MLPSFVSVQFDIWNEIIILELVIWSNINHGDGMYQAELLIPGDFCQLLNKE